MPTSIATTVCRDFLHVKVEGENTPETVIEYVRKLMQVCAEENQFRVLVEENLSGPRMSEIDVISVFDIGGIEALGFFEAIAFVDEQQSPERARFLESIASNRGYPLASFSSIEAARNWLLSYKPRENSPQSIREAGGWSQFNKLTP